MNNTNHSTKGNINPNSALRGSGSGRLKRPSRDLGSLNTNIKKPFLKEYSTAMEQKLQTLKEKISEKKKQKSKQQSVMPNKKAMGQKLQKFLKIKQKPEQKNLQQAIKVEITKQKLSNFLALHNLLSYQNVLIQNQIDSLQILADATQKELQQIGIPKGHALKLKINISKWDNNQFLQEKTKNMRQTKTKDSERNNSFVSNSKSSTSKPLQKNQDSIMQKKIQSICIGTQQDGIESIAFVSVSKPVALTSMKSRSRFCLFCYQSIKVINLADNAQFCSEDCSDRYNQMFKKYENNLMKAEEDFTKKDKPQLDNVQFKSDQKKSQEQNQQDAEVFDLLEDQNNYEDFDYEDYENLRKQLGND